MTELERKVKIVEDMAKLPNGERAAAVLVDMRIWDGHEKKVDSK